MGLWYDSNWDRALEFLELIFLLFRWENLSTNDSVDHQSSPTLIKLISGIDHTSNVKNVNVPLKRDALT